MGLDKNYTDRYNAGMDNRTRLLECAMTLFAARGYDAVGIQEVVDAAGVTKPTLYHYFSSKRGLLDALLEESFRDLLVELSAARAYQGDLQVTLERLANTYFQAAQRQPDFFRVQLSMQFAPPDSEPNQAVMPYMLAQYTLLEELFQTAVREYGNMSGWHRQHAATYMGMVHTYISIYLNRKTELTAELAYWAVKHYLHGIFS